MQASAREEILANGGSISHHHGGQRYFIMFFCDIARQEHTHKGVHGGLAPNGCMIVHIHNIIVSGEAILSAVNSAQPLDSQGSTPNPARRAHSAPQTS